MQASEGVPEADREISQDDADQLIECLLTAMSGSIIRHGSDEKNIPLIKPDHLLRLVPTPEQVCPL